MKAQNNWKKVIVPCLAAVMLVLAFGALSFAQGQRYKSADAWSFGVMGDTQWTLGRPDYSPDVWGRYGTPGYVYDADKNPFFISESIAKQVRAALISHKVKFVFQMGDSSNWGGVGAISTSAAAVAADGDLYDNNIGFFPLRGNHDTYSWWFCDLAKDSSGKYVRETRTDSSGNYNSYVCGTPWDPDWNHNIPAFLSSFPQTRGQGDYLFGATNFSSPSQLIAFDPTGAYENPMYEDNNALMGLSYSFDYGNAKSNARFVVVDTETVGWEFPDAQDSTTWYSPNYAPGQQQKWISDRLKKEERGTTHAFVLSHRQPMGQNHKESMFGAFDPNPFFKSLQDNEVRYYISAHDHLYHRSIVASPDLKSKVTQIISTGNSTKFYAPGALTEDQKARELSLSQELYNVGYYVYTVDGPRVTVEYYSDATGGFNSDYCWPYNTTDDPSVNCADRRSKAGNQSHDAPKLLFVRKDSFGYSLNGREFLVPQGASYDIVQDSFRGTTARIIAGKNNSTATDATPLVIDDNDTPEDTTDDIVTSWPRPFVKAVNTGWTPKTVDNNTLNSDILSLWGMADFGTEQTDVYVLSMSHDFRKDVHKGNAGIAALNAEGKWVNAVTLNIGAGNNPSFVYGPYREEYGLGTWGIDPKTKTAWAVLNYNADFAVADFTQNVPGKDKK